MKLLDLHPDLLPCISWLGVGWVLRMILCCCYVRDGTLSDTPVDFLFSPSDFLNILKYFLTELFDLLLILEQTVAENLQI